MQKLKKLFRKTIVCTMAVALALSMGVCVRADTYHDVRDGEVSLYLPDSWRTEEIDASDSEGLAYEKIVYAYDDSQSPKTELQIFYMKDHNVGDEFFYMEESEEAAIDYYNSYGKSALETLYSSFGNIEAFTLGDPIYFEGEWNSFIKIPVVGTYVDGVEASVPLQDVIYLRGEFTDTGLPVIHQILMFSNDGGTVIEGDASATMETIADEFYDYGYTDIMAGVEDDGSWASEVQDDGGFDADILIGIVSMIGILASVLAVGIVIARKVRKRFRAVAGDVMVALSRQGRKLQGELSAAQAGGNKSRRKREKQRMRNAQTHDHVQQIIRANEISRKDGRRSNDTEERYLRSLQTLRKSGLLTQEEMRDMLERHERNRRYRG